ncbi:MAG: hypothetical protein EOP49_47900 [Sphingobacteriales bacterium]|nr:MAG: hypothetical protein EOP49_47900 [Sphingobacteriales bacterium]
MCSADSAFGQTGKAPVNYLGVAGPLIFNNTNYQLVWTSHPSEGYYKQEYLPAGQKVDRFQSMLMLEAVSSKLVLKEVIGAKINELDEMKRSNPFVNYDMIFNKATNEYILDFLLTVNTADNSQVSVAEHNVYRYKSLPLRSGGNGVFLLAISTRSYGRETTAFIKNLRSSRAGLVSKLAAWKISLPDLK